MSTRRRITEEDFYSEGRNGVGITEELLLEIRDLLLGRSPDDIARSVAKEVLEKRDGPTCGMCLHPVSDHTQHRGCTAKVNGEYCSCGYCRCAFPST